MDEITPLVRRTMSMVSKRDMNRGSKVSSLLEAASSSWMTSLTVVSPQRMSYRRALGLVLKRYASFLVGYRGDDRLVGVCAIIAYNY